MRTHKHPHKQVFVLLLAAFCLSGCTTIQPNYKISAAEPNHRVLLLYSVSNTTYFQLQGFLGSEKVYPWNSSFVEYQDNLRLNTNAIVKQTGAKVEFRPKTREGDFALPYLNSLKGDPKTGELLSPFAHIAPLSSEFDYIVIFTDASYTFTSNTDSLHLEGHGFYAKWNLGSPNFNPYVLLGCRVIDLNSKKYAEFISNPGTTPETRQRYAALIGAIPVDKKWGPLIEDEQREIFKAYLLELQVSAIKSCFHMTGLVPLK